jgi:hypothetical protein
MKGKSLLDTYSEDRERRIEKAETEGWEYCICCGRRIKDTSKAVEIEMIDGGDVWTYQETNDYNDPGYMGAWWLGKTCFNAWIKSIKNQEK